MAGVDYCTVLPSWDFDKDPAVIVKYYFGQEPSSQTDENNAETGPAFCQDLNPKKCLTLTRVEGEEDACTVTLTCKPQYHVSICGLHVYCQAGLTEIYDASEGYLKTVRGQRVRVMGDDEGGEETEVVYRCRSSLDTCYGLTIKFPRLQGTSTLKIYKIVFILHPEPEDEYSRNGGEIGQTNMSKVRSYVTSLGDNLPEGARGSMESMEEFQQMCTTEDKTRMMDDIEEDGLIPHVQSRSFCVNIDGENDVEFSEPDASAAIGNNVRNRYERLNTHDSIQLNDSQFVSEIFVKHPEEDSKMGDPLGGFLCTGSRSDGTFLHAFCCLQSDGILAKDLLVKDKDILVSLIGKKTLGSFEYDHESVLVLFRTLPMSQTISMVIYNRQSEMFTTIEFLLEGTKEEVIVKENAVKLMSMPPKVKVLIARKDSTSLAVENGKLTLCNSANIMSNCSFHFIVRETLDDSNYLKYSFQVQKIKSKFLGLNGTELDIVDETNVASIKTFRLEIMNTDVYLRPCGRDDMYLCFNQTRKLFELKTRECAAQEEGCGMCIFTTSCPP